MRGMPAFVVEVNPGPHRRGPSPLLQSQAGRKQVGAGSGKARRRRDESRHWRWLPNPVGRKMRQRRRSGRLVGGEGRKRVGLGVLDLCRKGDDLLAAFADAAADLRTRRHGVGATATLLHGCGVMGTGQRHAPRQQRRHDDQNGQTPRRTRLLLPGLQDLDRAVAVPFRRRPVMDSLPSGADVRGAAGRPPAARSSTARGP